MATPQEIRDTLAAFVQDGQYTPEERYKTLHEISIELDGHLFSMEAEYGFDPFDDEDDEDDFDDYDYDDDYDWEEDAWDEYDDDFDDFDDEDDEDEDDPIVY